MGRITGIRDVIGIIKDKVSQSRAAITCSKPKTLSLHLAILRATTHDPFAPPTERHIAAVLSFGHSSRATASQVIEALMDRLQSTHDASVANKCLITVHRIIKEGSFILQDQLSIYPSNGGRNHLKLSNFRDNSSPVTWELSSWVRWYARYLEHLLSTSRILGFIFGSSSSSVDKDDEEEKASALTNSELVKEIDSLASLLEEMCKRPDLLHISGNKMVEEIMDLVGGDYLSAINHVSVRVDEFNRRLSSLSFSDSVELVCALKRLEGCKEKMSLLSTQKKALIEKFWCLINEMKSELGLGDVYREKGRLLLTMGRGLGEKGSESARFGERLLGYNDSVKFSSARFGLNSYSFGVEVSIDSCARRQPQGDSFGRKEPKTVRIENISQVLVKKDFLVLKSSSLDREGFWRGFHNS